jgi:ech hydrogenase subunit A
MLFLLMMMRSPSAAKRNHRHLAPYMCGRPTSPDMHFLGSLGVRKETVLSNYYLQDWFGEKRLKSWGIWICSAMIALMVASAILKGVVL